MKNIIVFLLLSLLSLSVSAQDKKGELKLDTYSYNFGTVKRNTVRSVVFVVKNTGKAPVVIQSADAACACTNVSYTLSPIKPGKKGYIKVWFYSAKFGSGTFNKTVDVRSNASNGIIRLSICGKVATR